MILLVTVVVVVTFLLGDGLARLTTSRNARITGKVAATVGLGLGAATIIVGVGEVGLVLGLGDGPEHCTSVASTAAPTASPPSNPTTIFLFTVVPS